MRDVMFLLAVYGSVTVWMESYLPWLTPAEEAGDGAPPPPQKPPFGDLVKWMIDWIDPLPGRLSDRKPWGCMLCMSFVLGVPLYLMRLWAPTFVVVAALAGVAFVQVTYSYRKYLELVAP